MKLSPGLKAPLFTADDQTGRAHRLQDYLGKWVLLYFYPKDDTPGCTREACGIRDAFADYKKRDIVVFGVSIDTAASHKKFAAKYKLPFTLLADPDKKIVKAYGVWGKKKFMGREYLGTRRMSFLIAPDGKVAHVYESVKPDEHAAEVLKNFDSITLP